MIETETWNNLKQTLSDLSTSNSNNEDNSLNCNNHLNKYIAKSWGRGTYPPNTITGNYACLCFCNYSPRTCPCNANNFRLYYDSDGKCRLNSNEPNCQHLNQTKCTCDCNYCTSNKNGCVCNTHSECTSNKNECTCNTNYNCVCNCNY